MDTTSPPTAIAVVGLGAILPDGPTVATFWQNVKEGRYGISEVPPDRWDPDLYYDPDPKAPDKTYSKIGGWVRDWEWDPLGWKLPIPPRVSEAMDDGQKWALACTREALLDFGYPQRALDPERTAVILGNALAGEKHYLTSLRINFPEFAEELAAAPSFMALPNDVQRAIISETHTGMGKRLPEVTEDTMPGELSNVLAGRVANLFNFRGPNFTTDAACASAMAAMNAAVQGLRAGDYDAVITGGIDRNMGPYGFVKFCKIGALSATGTRPYDRDADGFVMGEGAAVFLLKRLADAERDGDRIYALVRALAGSSDGRGKGITAPNPVGQRLAVERAWGAAGLPPQSATMVEGHGTSTAVGDLVEVESLQAVFGADSDMTPGSIALGSVKSNIGHLKSAAGAAGMLKSILSLHERVLPPSLNFNVPNPGIDWTDSPFRVNTELRDWEAPVRGPRRAGVSAFGFGGTNFHAVLEEYGPEARGEDRRTVVSVPASVRAVTTATPKAPLRGALVLGADTPGALADRLRVVRDDAAAGRLPAPTAPSPGDLAAAERVAIDHADSQDLVTKADLALRAFDAANPAAWRALRARGIHRGGGPAPKVAFLYTGQGSQYVNMLRELVAVEPLVREVFDEADRVMIPLLGKPLSDYIFVDGDEALARAELDLMQTAITQPAVLAADLALTKLLGAYGVAPDMVMGHSLGEYGALVAAGALTFEHALEAVSARGREMSSIHVQDNGKMAAVLAPIEEIERVLARVDGYVVIANINSRTQAVIGGESAAVDAAVDAFAESGHQAMPLPVSHAFHTSIVAPASEPLREALVRLELRPPEFPIVANVSGEFYPMGPDVAPEMLDILGAQVASPVQFVKGLSTLYEAGARVFVEVGPKKALQGFAEEVLGGHDDVLTLFANHPKWGDVVSFNQALCGLYAAGLGNAPHGERPRIEMPEEDALRRRTPEPVSDRRPPVVVTGAGLGLPGGERVFDESNVARILSGTQLIDVIPTKLRRAMLDKHVTRLVKRDNGDPSFEAIDDPGDVIKLAGRGHAVDLEAEFGVAADRVPALDRATILAVGAGIDALRDAGIPLVMRYKTTSKGTQLPDGWGLPPSMADDTGVIFASAFPGLDAFADEITRYHEDRSRRTELASLEDLGAKLSSSDPVDETSVAEVDRRIHELRVAVEAAPYRFDRRFLFKCLSMGHAQFAEIIGARGPNAQINSACASTTQAIAMAQDWIDSGRCRRVVIVAADDATSDHLFEWIGAGFLASGAAATDDVVEDAATPFDRRRHGMIVGMGAVGLVVERADAARERGLRPIVDVLGTVTANSAFHGSRLDVHHITGVMERLVSEAEERWDLRRSDIASQLVFVSHETYTPARGGSAAAEVEALRAVFGPDADSVVVANTKGFTGHPMGVGIEDVVAVKSLETGIVPPVPNYREIDPDLGTLNLSKGGLYPVRYALRLAAGFGSQISMTLLRWVPSPDGTRRAPDELGYAYRITDQDTWSAWLTKTTGQAEPKLEVAQHRLRVVEPSMPSAPVAPAADEPASRPVVVAAPAEGPAVVEPAPEPEPAPAETIPSAAGPSDAEIRDRVLALVAQTTGYPVDMLDPELDLEADLGVDTVKQAEIFQEIRAVYGIARDETLKLRDFPTLEHVIGFVRDRAGAAPAAIAEPALGESIATESAAPHQPIVDVEGANAVLEVATPTASISDDEIRERVLTLVAEKTGYPIDMLDPELDLEADLGVDTVKQAEIFQEIRSAYGIARDDTLKLRDFPTIEHVIGFVRDRAGATAPVVDHDSPSTAVPSIRDPEIVRAGLEETNAVPRRVPIPVLRPNLAECAPTGLAFDPASRVLVVADASGVGKHLIALLEEAGVTVLTVDDAPPAQELTARVESWLAGGPVDGVFWLPALDPGHALEALDLDDWREGLRRRVKLLYALMRSLPGDPFLVAGTRLGGQHGYDPDGSTDVMGGAVTGFVKAYKRERPAAVVKAVDVEVDADGATVSKLLQAEALADPGVVEVGYRDGLRWTVGLAERPAELDGVNSLLGPETVFVVTGAAGSIVSAIVSDLAAATGGTFHLLDLAPPPDPSDPALERFATDRDGLKRELFDAMKARGERATPALVERELSGIERRRAALDAITAIRSAGGDAVYHQVDLTDSDAVTAVVDAVVARHGRVGVLVHAAGLEISHLLPDKEPREFDLVFDVKANGWFNVMRALAGTPLDATVAFSSVAGRFGNAGQTDYSAANDLLCKAASNLRRVRPDASPVAIDWTAWAGIGMASRGSIPTMMEQAGIDMLAPEAGIPLVRRELLAGTRGEIVVGHRLGVLVDEWAHNGGVAPVPATGPMMGTKRSFGIHEGLTVETVLQPATEPFLNHHRIEGTPVLPGVMGVEAFAELATQPLQRWVVDSVEDVRFLAPFKFYRDEPRTLAIAGVFEADGEDVVARCRLDGSRSLPTQSRPQVTTHFTGWVRMTRHERPAEVVRAPIPAGEGVGPEDIYAIYFHGPAYQVLERAWPVGDGALGLLAADLPPDHSSEEPFVLDPRILELAFQTAGIWELATVGRLALPAAFDRLVVPPKRPAPTGRVLASVRAHGATDTGSAFDAVVSDEAGAVLLQLEGYRTIPLPWSVDEGLLGPLRAAAK
jgi:acyl transferase domain-containing protein/NAD(P)-dependent dehydrogenase (short-subunit alcohol dehydrogenase family)/acyl carrier protein